MNTAQDKTVFRNVLASQMLRPQIHGLKFLKSETLIYIKKQKIERVIYQETERLYHFFNKLNISEIEKNTK